MLTIRLWNYDWSKAAWHLKIWWENWLCKYCICRKCRICRKCQPTNTTCPLLSASHKCQTLTHSINVWQIWHFDIYDMTNWHDKYDRHIPTGFHIMLHRALALGSGDQFQISSGVVNNSFIDLIFQQIIVHISGYVPPKFRKFSKEHKFPTLFQS